MDNIEQDYITGENNFPLIVYGPHGCGKTTLIARIAQCCQQKIPEALLIIRFVGISDQSSTVEQLLYSITNQCSILAHGHKCYCNHKIETYKNVLPSLLATSSLKRPLVIMLDGLDQIKEFSSNELDWLPTKLPDNIKLIISVLEDSPMQKDLRKILTNKNSFIKMPLLGEAEAKNILMSCVVQYNHSVNSKIQDCVLKSVQECTIPLYSKVLAWQTSWWVDKDHAITPKGQLTTQLDFMFEELEGILGATQVQHALAIITCAKQGVTDSEMMDLLAFDDAFYSSTTYGPMCYNQRIKQHQMGTKQWTRMEHRMGEHRLVSMRQEHRIRTIMVRWAPACLAWSRLIKHLTPFLIWSLTEGIYTIQWKDDSLRKAAVKRYGSYRKWAHQMLFNYFDGKWWRDKPEKIQARIITQESYLGKWYE